jgi:hypothetical protein
MTDPAEIADKLEPIPRRAILATRDGWFSLGSARGVPAELKSRTIDGHCLTPLGLSVRAVLQEKV